MIKYEKTWMEDFLIRSTWATNAIEGNSLSLVQTMSIITDGTIPVSSGQATEIKLNEVKEVENGKRAFEVMFLALEKVWPINEELIKTFHHEITKNLIDYPGQWKIYENIVRGTTFKTTKAKDVPQAIADLLKWFNEHMGDKDVFKVLADFHVKFEMIHPFEDGNGRAGRLLLNYQLMSVGYFPVFFPSRKEYLTFLTEDSSLTTDWKSAKASKKFIDFIKSQSEDERERNEIFKIEREKGLTQEHYSKKIKNLHKED